MDSSPQTDLMKEAQEKFVAVLEEIKALGFQPKVVQQYVILIEPIPGAEPVSDSEVPPVEVIAKEEETTSEEIKPL